MLGFFLRTGASVGEQLSNYSRRVGTALGAEGDEALGKVSSYLNDGKLGDNAEPFAPEIQGVLDQVRSAYQKSGTMYSDEAIGSMKSNFLSTGNVFGGLSAATETRSGNLALQSLQEGGLIGVGIGAALGAGGAAVTGGEAPEGAMIGALVGAGVGGISRALVRSSSSIEESMMKRLLGDNYDKLGQKTVTTPGKVTPEMRLAEAKKHVPYGDEINPTSAYYKFDVNDIGNVKNAQGGRNLDGTAYGWSYNLPGENVNFTTTYYMKKDPYHGVDVDEQVLRQAATTTKVEDLGVNEARQARLQTVRDMTDDQLNKVSGGRAMRKRLTSNKEDSLLTQSRTLTLAGAFLGGVAFTSKKNDHRRGFNKNRGNRI
jgi:hypothetical protein